MNRFPDAAASCYVRFYKKDGSMKETQVVEIVRTGRDHVTLLTPLDPGHMYTSVRLSLQPEGWLQYLREQLKQQRQDQEYRIIIEAASQGSCYGFHNLSI